MTDTSGNALGHAPAIPAAHTRHSAARWPGLRSLRLKLVVAGALWVAVVIGGLTAAGLGIAERRLEDDLRDTARLTAVAVADDLELRAEAVGSPSMAHTLHEFLDAAPSVRDIALFSLDDATPQFALGTSSAPPVGAERLVEEAMRSGRTVAADRTPQLTAAATPVMRDGQVAGIVLVTVSLGPVARLRDDGRLFAAGVAAFAVFGITVLLLLLTQRLVHAPLTQLLRVVTRVKRGDLSVRAPVLRGDEIGEVADGINGMLSEIESLHGMLQERVEAATRELRQRNEQLVRSYESVLTLRDELARARELATVGQTLANVAHQVGTPLNLVSAHVQLLQQELRDDAAAQRRLSVIAEQVDRVTTTVHDLLDRARPDSSSRTVAMKPLLMRLAGSVPVLRAGVDVDVRVPDDLPFVYGDETQLELALMNLITNALDAMPEGGRLTLAATAAPPGVVIDVADTGPGIPPDLVSRIFEPWVTSKPGRGTGLGLSITRDVVQRAGGTIEMHSADSGGTRFRVSLPAAGGT